MKNKVTTSMIISFITNTFLSILKLVVGILGKSGALVADGIHSFSDLVTDLVAIIGSAFSNKPADNKHPFGHGKLEYLTSLFIGLIVLFLGFTVIKESFSKEFAIPSIIVITVSIITIITKMLLALFLLNRGKNLKNNILISSGKESLTDVFSSIVVFISLITIQFSKYVEIFKYSDIFASIIIGILIIKVGFNIIKDNISILLGECETDEEILNELKNKILDNKNVYDISNLVLIKYGSYYKLSFEVDIDGNLSFVDAHNLVHKIENNIKKYNEKIKYVMVHANPYIKIKN